MGSDYERLDTAPNYAARRGIASRVRVAEIVRQVVTCAACSMACARRPVADRSQNGQRRVMEAEVEVCERWFGEGFRDAWLRAFVVDDVRSRNIPSDLEARLFRKLQMIDDAVTDQDMRAPPSNHFENLRGNLAGLHWIRVNQQWRLIFRWDGARDEADGICSDDHRYG